MRRLAWLLVLGVTGALIAAACAASDDSRGRSVSSQSGFDGVVTVPASPPSPEFSGFDEDFRGDFAFEEEAEQAGQAFFEEAPRAEAAQAVSDSAAGLPNTGGSDNTVTQIAERKIISTASIGITVEAVRETADTIAGIAESLGGFVERASISGNDQFAHAELTIRVPQDQFSAALESLRRLGEVQDENLGQLDVSEQFIDLEARLESATREEDSLLRLLGRTETVSEIIALERELSRVRTEVERTQGQLNFLERRVSLATINISLFTPQANFTEPPSASLTMEVSNVTRTVDDLRALAVTFGGVVERVILSVNEDEESANLGLRVPRDQFAAALAAIESRGDVLGKQVREGEGSFDTDVELPEEADARIDVQLFDTGDGSDVGLIAAIVVPSVAAGLLVIGGLAVWLRRREPSVV